MNVTRRPITSDDAEFLYQVYASTRAAEMALVNWSAEQQEAFLRMQFTAQHQYYQENYPNAAFDVVMRDGSPVGRLYVDRWPEEIRIVDIALLPEMRGAGIGTLLLRAILAEGDRARKPVSIHVERFSPALSLYRRLGFAHIDEHGVYYLMRWSLERVSDDQAKTA